MSILSKFENFKQLKGYLGAGVFSMDGKMLGGITEVSGINFEIAGARIHDAFVFMNNNTKESGFGKVEMLQAKTERGTILCRYLQEEDISFYTILVVQRDANLGMARLMLERVSNTLKEEFKR